MSERGSSGRPSICSGDMYGIVPSTVPSLVCAIVSSVPAPDRSAIFARPKSRILMRPLRVTITLAGFRSRWTMPFSCAAASPSASSSAIVMQRVDRQAFRRNLLVERRAVHELHRQVVQSAGLLDGVNRDDVRVVEGGDGARFTTEALGAHRVVRHRLGKDLQRDVAAKRVVRRAVHLAHPAGAQRTDDLVVPDASSGSERHRRG